MDAYDTLRSLIKKAYLERKHIDNFFTTTQIGGNETVKYIELKERYVGSLMVVLGFANNSALDISVRSLSSELANLLSLVHNDVNNLTIGIMENIDSVLSRMETAISTVKYTKHQQIKQIETPPIFSAVQELLNIPIQFCTPKDIEQFLDKEKYIHLSNRERHILIADIGILLASIDSNSHGRLRNFLIKTRELLIDDKDTIEQTSVTVSNSIELISDFSRKNVFAVFGKELNIFECREMNDVLCRDILEEVDRSAYTSQQLSSILKTLASFVDEAPQSRKKIIRILMKEVSSVIEDKEAQEKECKQKQQFHEEEKKIATLISDLSTDAYKYIEWTLRSLNNFSNIFSFATFADVQKDKESYDVFMQLYDNFFSWYTSMFYEKITSAIAKANITPLSFSPKLNKSIYDLHRIYSVSYFSPEKFFLAVKYGYIFGDIYQFFLDMQKDIPLISYEKTGLKKYLDRYSK